MINIIGLGYIGLPTALMFASHGVEVVGTDYNKELVATLNAGKTTFDLRLIVLLDYCYFSILLFMLNARCLNLLSDTIFTKPRTTHSSGSSHVLISIPVICLNN